MNLLFHLTIIALTLSLTLGCASTQSSKEGCLELTKKANQSFQADNWKKYIKDSKNYIESCRNVDSSESISMAYSLMVVAFLNMKQPNDALDSANLCISTYYANPDCHLKKATILLQLHRFEEAKNSLNIAERTTKEQLSVIDSYIIASRSSPERESYMTKKASYMQTLEFIELLRKIFSPK